MLVLFVVIVTAIVLGSIVLSAFLKASRESPRRRKSWPG